LAGEKAHIPENQRHGQSRTCLVLDQQNLDLGFLFRGACQKPVLPWSETGFGNRSKPGDVLISRFCASFNYHCEKTLEFSDIFILEIEFRQ
jgi:hypothetical protein